ncbi:LamB/YcsF family protein [Frigoribacterium sp. 2-23]|uniref:LamB/YcsF family protein n=1 Tax=Frigoribacterium sp. 2-23 TaxID=3415006 RepID=UPI003C6F29A8
MTSIDLNSDLGEGFGRWQLGDDAAMLRVVTSANIACGFHAGDPEMLLATVARAHDEGVVIGAHVSYRDLAGFGRRFVDASPGELIGDVIYQLGALDGLARASGTAVRYVKPHGALYNVIAGRGDRADAHGRAVVEAITRYEPSLPVVGLAGSRFLALAAEAGLPTVAEAFADRAYTASGELVSRRQSGAVLDDPDEIADRVLRLVETGLVRAVDGTDVRVDAQSVCVHGDSPAAVETAVAVRRRLERAGVDLHAFARQPKAAR